MQSVANTAEKLGADAEYALPSAPGGKGKLAVAAGIAPTPAINRGNARC